MHKKTEIGHTLTSEGYIQHMAHPTLQLLMPVRVVRIADINTNVPPQPVRKNGRLVYVGPDGSDFLG